MKSTRWFANSALITFSLFTVNTVQAGLTADVSYTVGIGSGVKNASVVFGTTKFSGFHLGEIVLTQAAPLGAGYESPWSTVCLDIMAKLQIGATYTFHQAQFDGTSTGLNPKWGFGDSPETAAQAIQNAADIFHDHAGEQNFATAAARNTWWAALQLAVWEVLYDTGNASQGFNLQNGSFRVDSIGDANVINLANSWLLPSNQKYSGDLLIPLVDMGSETSRVSSINPGVQELLYTVTPVPETPTILAGALLLLPFAASTVRFIRRRPVP